MHTTVQPAPFLQLAVAKGQSASRRRGRRGFVLFAAVGLCALALYFVDHLLADFGLLEILLPGDLLLLNVASVQELLRSVTSSDKFSKTGFFHKDAMVIFVVNLFACWIFVWFHWLQFSK